MQAFFVQVTEFANLLQTFSTTSFGFSLVTVSRLCCFTATEEGTWCPFQKKVQICFLRSGTQFQLRHYCISIFHLEWSKYLLSTSLWAHFESYPTSTVFRGQIFSIPCPDSRVVWSLNKRFPGFWKGWSFNVSKTHFAFLLGQTLKWDWTHDDWHALA